MGLNRVDKKGSNKKEFQNQQRGQKIEISQESFCQIIAGKRSGVQFGKIEGFDGETAWQGSRQGKGDEHAMYGILYYLLM